MGFTVTVGNLFHSIVYHVIAEEGGIKFLVYDPFHRRFDLVDAEMCQPNEHLTQPPAIQRKVLDKLQKDRDQAVFRRDKEKQEHREQRRAAGQKGNNE